MEVSPSSGCVPALHPQWLGSAGLCCCPSCCWLEGEELGQDCSVHAARPYTACTSNPTEGDRLGICSCKAVGWEGGFWLEWVLEFGHLISGVVVLQSAVLWVWHWALLSQGHRRLMVLLTVLLMPDDGTDDAKGNCQDFASCFPRNGAINEEGCTYCKLRLSCWYGSFLHKGHCMPPVPVNIPCFTKLPQITQSWYK